MTPTTTTPITTTIAGNGQGHHQIRVALPAMRTQGRAGEGRREAEGKREKTQGGEEEERHGTGRRWGTHPP